jgi:hypothetical protein
METNGVARDRMFAINYTDPLARTDDSKPEPNKSSTEDNRRELADAVKELKRRTGAPRVALVANSRGGDSVRNFVKNGGGVDVSHAVLCGTPNHGVYAWDQNLGSEFNGRGPFLRGLNEGDSEVTRARRSSRCAATAWINTRKPTPAISASRAFRPELLRRDRP